MSPLGLLVVTALGGACQMLLAAVFAALASTLACHSCAPFRR